MSWRAVTCPAAPVSLEVLIDPGRIPVQHYERRLLVRELVHVKEAVVLRGWLTSLE